MMVGCFRAVASCLQITPGHAAGFLRTFFEPLGAAERSAMRLSFLNDARRCSRGFIRACVQRLAGCRHQPAAMIVSAVGGLQHPRIHSKRIPD